MLLNQYGQHLTLPQTLSAHRKCCSKAAAGIITSWQPNQTTMNLEENKTPSMLR